MNDEITLASMARKFKRKRAQTLKHKNYDVTRGYANLLCNSLTGDIDTKESGRADRPRGTKRRDGHRKSRRGGPHVIAEGTSVPRISEHGVGSADASR